MTLRKFTHVPLWVDWIARVGYWIDYHWPKPDLSWRWTLVDRFCICEQCKEAAARNMPRNRWFEDGWTGI